MAAGSYRVNAPLVTHEVIDGDALIINFDSGAYYSLAGSGLAVWEGIARGEPLAVILQGLAQRYDADAGVIAGAVHDLVAQFVAENLVVPDDAPENGRSPDARTAEPAVPRVPFVAPVLDKYSDMEDFLLVDPIHETDESGWPRRKTDGRGPV